MEWIHTGCSVYFFVFQVFEFNVFMLVYVAFNIVDYVRKVGFFIVIRWVVSFLIRMFWYWVTSIFLWNGIRCRLILCFVYIRFNVFGWSIFIGFWYVYFVIGINLIALLPWFIIGFIVGSLNTNCLLSIISGFVSIIARTLTLKAIWNSLIGPFPLRFIRRLNSTFLSWISTRLSFCVFKCVMNFEDRFGIRVFIV